MMMMYFYHKFIPHFVDIAAPLNAIRKKEVKFTLDRTQQEAFDALKRAISYPHVLKVSDFSQTDVSYLVLGRVLLQRSNGNVLPIAYANRILTSQERRASSTYELECLTVLFGTDKFCKSIDHQDLVLETDNKALFWLLS
jgi:hypothetical protein